MVDARVIRAQEKYDEVHKELIEAGIKLLSIKPISSLSLNSLAEYTEVSKTSIYNHFNSSPEHFYYDVLVHCRNYMLDFFNDTAPKDSKQKIIYFYEIYIDMLKSNTVLCLNLYSQFFIVNNKARVKLFRNKYLVSLLKEIGIDDEAVAKELSIEFESLLYKFFVLDPDSAVFKKYEKEFYKRLKKTLNY